MTEPIANPLVDYPDITIDRMRDAAWRRATREIAEVRQWCEQHGSGAHNEACLMLAASARSADRVWHTLMVEATRRHVAGGNTNSAPYLTPNFPAR